jgi:hypothetical protein
MAPRFLTILTGRNLPKIIRQPRGPAVDRQRKDDRGSRLGRKG